MAIGTKRYSTPMEQEGEEGSESHGEEAHGAGPHEFVWLRDHLVADITASLDLWRREERSLGVAFNVANLTDDLYPIAKESAATPVQYAPRRVVAASIRLRF